MSDFKLDVRASQPIGALDGNGNVWIEACEVIDIDRREVQHFVGLSVIDANGVTGKAELTIAQIESAIVRLPMLMRVNTNISKFKNFEANIILANDLNISVFTVGGPQLRCKITIGNVNAILNSASSISDLTAFFRRSLDFIEKNKAAL